MSKEYFDKVHRIYLEQQEMLHNIRKRKMMEAKTAEGDADAMADPDVYTPPRTIQIKLDIDDPDIE